MASYNKVLLMGNLTRDIELKYTPSNMAVAEIGLAVNHRFKTKEGEAKEEVTFVDCEAWGRTAEVMKQYLVKGRPVFVEGRLKLDQWKDKQDGSNRSKLRVVIENFQFIDSKGGGDSSGPPSGGSGGGSRSSGRSEPAAVAVQHEAISEDDIPF
jgi:single-strand DNA-binding protein